MIDLTPDELRLARAILARHVPEQEARVFGSRAKGNAKPHSDLDLVLMEETPLPDRVRAELLADFDESDLPFRVDLVEWRDASQTLRAAIARESFTLTSTKER